MKNMPRVLLGVFVVSAICVGAVQAQDTQGYEVILQIPTTSSVTFTATAIRGADEDWDETPSAALDFGMLTFENGVFVADRYYAIDLGTTGVGQPNQITFSYAEVLNPNQVAGNGRGGLGQKATMNVNKAVWFEPETTPPAEETIVAKRTLASSNALAPLLSGSFAGGWPRVYVAINTEAADGEVFNNLDAGGNYEGLFVISATVQ